jgi:hypothetical protein
VIRASPENDEKEETTDFADYTDLKKTVLKKPSWLKIMAKLV